MKLLNTMAVKPTVQGQNESRRLEAKLAFHQPTMSQQLKILEAFWMCQELLCLRIIYKLDFATGESR